MSLYRRLLQLLSLPVALQAFFNPDVGKEYGVRFFTKLLLVWRFIRNTQRIPTVSSWYEHITMAQSILSIPKRTAGVIVECGAYKGGSTANLSLVSQLVGRQLLIFDSFAGLPRPQLTDTRHHCPYLGEIHTYAKGSFTGRLSQVKHNIQKYGRLNVCQFFPGYFASTLPKFTRHPQPIICIFTDVDLTQSLKTCLQLLWPHVIRGGHWFTHEAHHQEIAQVFFDTSWWHRHLRHTPPGLIGAGSGLTFGLHGTALGYTVKSFSQYRLRPQ